MIITIIIVARVETHRSGERNLSFLPGVFIRYAAYDRFAVAISPGAKVKTREIGNVWAR